MNAFGGGFNQSKPGGFGQQAQMQPAAFGQQAPAQQAGGFGQQAPAQQAAFGQQPQAGGFGQQPAQQVGGFGQQAGGFGQATQPQGGFGQTGMSQVAGVFGQAQQQSAVGFGQPPVAGGFGQQAPQQVGGFGQPVGGFGQPAQQQGGFGQTGAAAQAGGFGQQQTQQLGGFGQQAQQQASGFGQPPPTTMGGFGQSPQQSGGFGQQTAGFGQASQQGGFGQTPQQQQSGFGQAATGGFGAARYSGGFGATGSFNQPAAPGGGFGASQPAVNTFGRPQQPQSGFGTQATSATQFGAGRGVGGFGTAPQAGFGSQQPASGGFGQQTTSTGFGQSTAPGGFGTTQQAGAGGFGAGRGTAGFGGQQTIGGGIGAGRGATGFGNPAQGGFGQAPQQVSGFGAQQAPSGGFGQSAPGGFGGGANQVPSGGGFGGAQQQQVPSAVGGFGAPGANTGGFGQPTSGFGTQQPAAGGFGQAAPATGFGSQPPAAGGFGAGRGASGFGVGGFGSGQSSQQPTASGFGAPKGAVGGFGQATGGGFGQPTSGFGTQQPAAGGFGQVAPATGFGSQPPSTGGFGQASAPAAPASGVAASTGVNVGRPTDLAFMSLPDYSATPYGNVLLFDSYERPQAAKRTAKTAEDDLRPVVPPARRAMHTWMVSQMRVPDESTLMKQIPASLASSSLSPVALKEMLVPAVQLGSTAAGKPAEAQRRETRDLQQVALTATVSAPVTNVAVPRCTNPDYVLEPSLAQLNTYTADELRRVTRFTVSRRDGSCEVRFLDPVNLVRADIGKVLRMGSDGHVALYPDGEAPPLSSGLNVRAEVRVRDPDGEAAKDIIRYCMESCCHFVGQRQGWCIYRLNDGRASHSTSRAVLGQETSDTVPLSIIRDEDENVHAIDDSCDDSEEDAAHMPTAEQPQAATGSDGALVISNAEVRTYTVPPPPPASRKPVMERHRVSAAAADFELPYALPDMTPRGVCVPFSVKLGTTRYMTQPRVYYVRAQESMIQRAYVNHTQPLEPSEWTIRGMLARSARAGWCAAGCVAFPSYAELRDGAEAADAVPEVVGACPVTATPFHWHKPAQKVLTQCAVALLRLFLQHTDVADNMACPLASIHLHRSTSHNTLSEEKLRVASSTIQGVISSVGEASLSRVEKLSTQQTHSVLALLSALYALPEEDAAVPNAMEEARYLSQLRHRHLAGWLKAELAAFLDSTAMRTAHLSPAEELVQAILCHKLRDARNSALLIANEDLARVVRVCGEGNQFGGYVEMAKGGFKNGEEVRQRVVSLLSGKVEPFICDEEYTGLEEGATEVRAAPTAATWKQLLGIFTFYGCVPDTPAEDIIQAFLERLRDPSSRKLNPLPPYAERVGHAVLRTSRGRDAVRRGNTFQDSALLVLEGFAHGSAPPAACLHPHASSYSGVDYLTAFVITAAIRAVELPRDQTYRDGELSVLLGITAELECNDETWFWGLLPLHMIECPNSRFDAVRAFCKRNAMRASAQKQLGNSQTDYNRLVSLLRVDESWLVPAVAPPEEKRSAVENMPSVVTLAALEKALSKLSVQSW